ncbi:hypothetical protein Goari_019274, partial [Gossypium aridum]|nr:hypothetical protein [Gossypium aridum]
MEESGRDDRVGGDEISLLAEELIQLSVKCSMVNSTKKSIACHWVTFGGVIKSEINGDLCRLRIKLDVQKPLHRGIFVSIDNQWKSWISFKYEKLLIFYFGCGRMGHGFKDCLGLTP